MSAFKTLLATAAVATALMAASTAQAAVVAFEDFQSYTVTNHGGANFYDLNFTAFTHGWTVSEGAVDLIGTPNEFNLDGGLSDNFVDIDGSIFNGGIMRTASWAFNAGDRVVVEFDLAGNQRGGSDQWDFGFQTTGGFIDFTNIIRIGSLNLGPGSSAFGPAIGAGNTATGPDAPWEHYSLSFVAGNSGSLTAYVATTSEDNIGPLVDNLSLSIGAVPEPATWLTMILGFGGIGAMVRRRRAVPAFA